MQLFNLQFPSFASKLLLICIAVFPILISYLIIFQIHRKRWPGSSEERFPNEVFGNSPRIVSILLRLQNVRYFTVPFRVGSNLNFSLSLIIIIGRTLNGLKATRRNKL